MLEARADLARYRAAVPGAAITVVRLSAAVPTLAARLRQRELGSGLAWSLGRAAELAAQMERDQVEDLLVATDGRSLSDLAHEVLRRSGWPDAPAAPR